MKKIFRKWLVSVLALVMLSVFVIPGLAAVPETVMPLGNGYTSGQIYINGGYYPATFSVAGSVSGGGRSAFISNGRCIRLHKKVNVTFSTASTTQEVYSGGNVDYKGPQDPNLNGMHVGVSGTTYSGAVQYGGMDTPTGIKYISATITVTMVDQDGTTRSSNFSASAS